MNGFGGLSLSTLTKRKMSCYNNFCRISDCMEERSGTMNYCEKHYTIIVHLTYEPDIENLKEAITPCSCKNKECNKKKKRVYALAKILSTGTEEERKWAIINRIKNKAMDCVILESLYRMMVINYDIDSFEKTILEQFAIPCSDESCRDACNLRQQVFLSRIKYIREVQNM